MREATRILRLSALKARRHRLDVSAAFGDSIRALSPSWAAQDKAWAAVQAAMHRAGIPYRFGWGGPSGAEAAGIFNDALSSGARL